jgi:hypothetical protein
LLFRKYIIPVAVSLQSVICFFLQFFHIVFVFTLCFCFFSLLMCFWLYAFFISEFLVVSDGDCFSSSVLLNRISLPLRRCPWWPIRFADSLSYVTHLTFFHLHLLCCLALFIFQYGFFFVFCRCAKLFWVYIVPCVVLLLRFKDALCIFFPPLLNGFLFCLRCFHCYFCFSSCKLLCFSTLHFFSVILFCLASYLYIVVMGFDIFPQG